jgi:nucleosome binding factor SPN SPT16 subunit
MEQQERKRRATLNKEFKAFAEKIAEAASTSVSASIDHIDPKLIPHRMAKL